MSAVMKKFKLKKKVKKVPKPEFGDGDELWVMRKAIFAPNEKITWIKAKVLKVRSYIQTSSNEKDDVQDPVTRFAYQVRMASGKTERRNDDQVIAYHAPEKNKPVSKAQALHTLNVVRRSMRLKQVEPTLVERGIHRVLIADSGDNQGKVVLNIDSHSEEDNTWVVDFHWSILRRLGIAERVKKKLGIET